MVINKTNGLEYAYLTFGWIDYTFFTLLMGVSLAIGIYFGFFKKQDNTTEYFLGGKTMNYCPIAMSILASHVSGMTLLGVPTEVYFHGSQYFAVVFTVLFMVLATIYIFLPVFSKLQIPSAFGYLEVRFARPVRLLCSFLYSISLLIFVPMVVYVPALAFSQVTGFSLHALSPILCIVCITYTTIGGLKAVVWTDTIQLSITCGGLLVIIGLGVKAVGGFLEVVRISDEGGRLVFFNMDPSPFQRNTFWGMAIGMTFHFTSHMSINQGFVQRCLAVPSRRDAVISVVLMGTGMVLLKGLSAFVGLIIYAYYHDCDPLAIDAIDRDDQLFPYYVMDVAGHLPGLPGLFLAGLVSAALSTMSANLNTVSGSLYEDFIEPWVPEGPRKEVIGANIMKAIVVVFGCLAGGLVFVVEHLGTVFQMGIALKSLLDGPVLGLFVLGMMVPWVKTRGAITGALLSIGIMAWLIFTTQWYQSQGRIMNDPLPVNVHGCAAPWNETIIPTQPPISPDDEPSMIYQISFLYYTLIGFFFTLFLSITVSLLLGETDISEVNPDHITPCIQRFLRRRKYAEVPLRDVDTVAMTSGENK
ncbi:sodium-coupled monocarboxylate transporter 1 [Diachasma alloeum]|uniref:sodium-coupled monocarboxylate transporter 1 n=1 Tax=Diachasma alloeum TaxID=454923 RepID=UPI0007383A04|nr:sodium-coupled monocarboxylate transporter 1 [Diachasma alloeum]